MKHKVVKSTSIFKGRVFETKTEEIILPTGEEAYREVVVHRGGASIVAITDCGKVVLVRQYRHAVGDYALEIPAGIIDNNEDPQVTATRELKEETGYTAATVTHLLTVYKSMGYTTEKHHIYLAQGLTAGTQSLDEGEDVEVVEVPLAEVMEKIWNGGIVDAKTVMGVLAYREKKV